MTRCTELLISRLRWFCAAGVAAALACSPQPASADDIVEPAVLSSSGGVLDILMIAKAKAVPTISFQPPGGGAAINPIGWVYEVCPRPASGNDCPPGPTTISDYGGVRLALQPGDVLKIRLINRLPSLEAKKVKHASEPGQGDLLRNPTNLHTHGLIVPARPPSSGDPTFGDYIFMQIFNPANGMPTETAHAHGSSKMDFADYRIDIPPEHPSGIFWFHPHVHGISLNQVSAGMAGIITIGKVRDYVESGPTVVRHLVLKDMQVLAAGSVDYGQGSVSVSDGEAQNQQITSFCEQRDNGGPSSRRGFCEGEPDEHGTGNSFVNSRWYFTINGQMFPTIRMASPDGEIWRFINASGQFSYQLKLVDDSTNVSMLMQLIAIDGVSIAVPPQTPPGTVMAVGGNKFTTDACPTSAANLLPVCVRSLVMMPSSRAEVWVTYRKADGTVVTPPAGATATLKQGTVALGPASEAWPEVKLAKVEFAHPAPAISAVAVAGNATAVSQALAAVAAAPHVAGAQPAAAACPPLTPGHRRRIYFGMENPSDGDSPFGLGYEEIIYQEGVAPQDQAVVPGTRVPVVAYDANRSPICLPLGPGGSVVHETWELVNLATETHNFHIHQTKFRVLDAVTQTPQNASQTPIILEDNIPVPFATALIPDIEESQNGYCTIEQWKTRKCAARPIVLDIPFSKLGEFVYHCHILEHEDGGMMAKIQVITGEM